MYTGVKTIISKYKKPFNSALKAKNKAKSRLREEGKKVTDKAVEEEQQIVLAEWALRAQMGTEAHTTIVKERLKKFPDAIVGTYEKAEDDVLLDAELINKLERNTTYYEKQIVDNQNMIIGYIDEVVVDELGYIHIQDFKTHKEIRRSYTARATNGFTIVENFYQPVQNLIDCNFIECALQVSFYLYTLWTYNKDLKFGKLTMLHTILDEETGNIISKEVIDLPFLIEEVKLILQNQKDLA